jgi:hypothetical protein
MHRQHNGGIEMGEAKRRKALGGGSSQYGAWAQKKCKAKRVEWTESSFIGNVQTFMDINGESFLGDLILDEGFSFLREILRRAEISLEWAKKRDHMATLIRSARDVVIIGVDPKAEEVEFLEESRGGRQIIFLETKPRKVDELLKKMGAAQ